MKIYVGCSLTQSPEEFKQDIAVLKRILRSRYEILDFVGLVNGTPRSVFEDDCRCVRECDILLAVCDYPANGLGGEMMLAYTLGKPILAVAHYDAVVSRFTQGFPPTRFTFDRYGQMSEVPSLIDAFVESFQGVLTSKTT